MQVNNLITRFSEVQFDVSSFIPRLIVQDSDSLLLSRTAAKLSVRNIQLRP
jgi:hypothetical protein